jgi:hypothetical protein
MAVVAESSFHSLTSYPAPTTWFIIGVSPIQHAAEFEVVCAFESSFRSPNEPLYEWSSDTYGTRAEDEIASSGAIVKVRSFTINGLFFPHSP